MYYTEREDYFNNRASKELEAIMEEIDDARTNKECPNILEIGAGSGIAIKLLKRMWNNMGNSNPLKIKGIDISKEAIELARGRGEPVEFGNALNTSFKNDEFDLVYGLYVIQDIGFPVKLIQECLRIARKVVLIFELGVKCETEPRKIISKSHKNLKQSTEQVVLNVENFKRFFSQIPNERHNIKKIYEFEKFNGKSEIYKVFIRKNTSSKSRMEVDKNGFSINRNSGGSSS